MSYNTGLIYGKFLISATALVQHRDETSVRPPGNRDVTDRVPHTMAVVAPGLILPSDVLIIVMESLEIDELLNLACTCKFVNLLVNLCFSLGIFSSQCL